MIDPANEGLLNGKNAAEEATNNTSNNSGGMGGMGGLGSGGMGGMLQQMLMSNPELLQDPEVMGALNDTTLMNKLKMYEQTGNMQAMFSDPQVSNLIQKFQNKVKKPEGFDEKASEFTSGHGHDPKTFDQPREVPKVEKKRRTKKGSFEIKRKSNKFI